MNKISAKNKYNLAYNKGDYIGALKTALDFISSYTPQKWMKLQEQIFPKHVKATLEFKTKDLEAVKSLIGRRIKISLMGNSNTKAIKEFATNIKPFITMSTKELGNKIATDEWQGWEEAFLKGSTEENKDIFYELKNEIENLPNGVYSFMHSIYGVFDFGEKYEAIMTWENEHNMDIRLAKMEDYLTAKTGVDYRTYDHTSVKPKRLRKKSK